MKVVHVFLLLHSASALEDEFYIKRWNLLLSWKALGGVSMCVWSFSASRHLSTFDSARHKTALVLSKVLWIDRNSLYSSQIRHFHHLRQPPPPFSPPLSSTPSPFICYHGNCLISSLSPPTQCFFPLTFSLVPLRGAATPSSPPVSRSLPCKNLRHPLLNYSCGVSPPVAHSVCVHSLLHDHKRFALSFKL